MTEPFKNVFNRELIAGMADHLGRHFPDFDTSEFRASATRGLDDLELKERSDNIVEALAQFLPESFEKSAPVLMASLMQDPPDDLYEVRISESGIAGWAIMPMGQYVALHGQEHFDISMQLLEAMTSRFTSESAIRPFLIEQPVKTLAQMLNWTKNGNRHVRRLASEGCRPRLPWSMQLTEFVKDPGPLLPILEALKNDGAEYVRRSVANNLNDIAKDHPDLVAGIAAEWLVEASKDQQRMVRHACRSLLKQGHQKTLTALGYARPQVSMGEITITTKLVNLGEYLEFDIDLQSRSDTPQLLMIDYIIHHKKANGGTTPKVFKWKNLTVGPNESPHYQKRHAIRKITTREYYAGTHFLEIQINGKSFGKSEFELAIQT